MAERWFDASKVVSRVAKEAFDVRVDDGPRFGRGKSLGGQGTSRGRLEVANVLSVLTRVRQRPGELDQASLKIGERFVYDDPPARHSELHLRCVDAVRSHIRRLRQRQRCLKRGGDRIAFPEGKAQVKTLPQCGNDRSVVERIGPCGLSIKPCGMYGEIRSAGTRTPYRSKLKGVVGDREGGTATGGGTWS